jgi:hypothetical protein
MTDEQSGRGGDIIFTAGVGHKDASGFQHPGGDFIFVLPDGTEWMRIAADGVATVRGEKVDQNKDVFDAFVKWLNRSEIKT